MTVGVNANIHFNEDDVWHRFHPGDDKCGAYGALKFKGAATLYFDKPALIDAVIAELVALRAEMDPPAPGEGGVLFPAGPERDEPASPDAAVQDDDCWLPLAEGACGDGDGIACGVIADPETGLHGGRHERESKPGLGAGICHWPNLADPETGTEPQPETAASVTA